MILGQKRKKAKGARHRPNIRRWSRGRPPSAWGKASAGRTDQRGALRSRLCPTSRWGQRRCFFRQTGRRFARCCARSGQIFSHFLYCPGLASTGQSGRADEYPLAVIAETGPQPAVRTKHARSLFSPCLCASRQQDEDPYE